MPTLEALMGGCCSCQRLKGDVSIERILACIVVEACSGSVISYNNFKARRFQCVAIGKGWDICEQ